MWEKIKTTDIPAVEVFEAEGKHVARMVVFFKSQDPILPQGLRVLGTLLNESEMLE